MRTPAPGPPDGQGSWTNSRIPWPPLRNLTISSARCLTWFKTTTTAVRYRPHLRSGPDTIALGHSDLRKLLRPFCWPTASSGPIPATVVSRRSQRAGWNTQPCWFPQPYHHAFRQNGGVPFQRARPRSGGKLCVGRRRCRRPTRSFPYSSRGACPLCWMHPGRTTKLTSPGACVRLHDERNLHIPALQDFGGSLCQSARPAWCAGLMALKGTATSTPKMGKTFSCTTATSSARESPFCL